MTGLDIMVVGLAVTAFAGAAALLALAYFWWYSPQKEEGVSEEIREAIRRHPSGRSNQIVPQRERGDEE
ncbi:hypothetical protein ACIRLA_46535 [Streptomyces sp. NPDC102364]|uniref:hypothetical protein n=1 Tax=Streptomyces sp. NPDC102364 TaxID=3366161 RepID=UPI00380C09BE